MQAADEKLIINELGAYSKSGGYSAGSIRKEKRTYYASAQICISFM